MSGLSSYFYGLINHWHCNPVVVRRSHDPACCHDFSFVEIHYDSWKKTLSSAKTHIKDRLLQPQTFLKHWSALINLTALGELYVWDSVWFNYDNVKRA